MLRHGRADRPPARRRPVRRDVAARRQPDHRATCARVAPDQRAVPGARLLSAPGLGSARRCASISRTCRAAAAPAERRAGARLPARDRRHRLDRHEDDHAPRPPLAGRSAGRAVDVRLGRGVRRAPLGRELRRPAGLSLRRRLQQPVSGLFGRRLPEPVFGRLRLRRRLAFLSSPASAATGSATAAVSVCSACWPCWWRWSALGGPRRARQPGRSSSRGDYGDVRRRRGGGDAGPRLPLPASAGARPLGARHPGPAGRVRRPGRHRDRGRAGGAAPAVGARAAARKGLRSLPRHRRARPDEPHQRRDRDERHGAGRARALPGRARAGRRRARRRARRRRPRRAKRRWSWWSSR